MSEDIRWETKALGDNGGLCLSHAFFTGPISIVPYSIDQVKLFNYPTQPFRFL